MRAVAAATLVVAAGACLWLNWPGHFSYDSVVQLAEGRAGAYSGEHPPVMSWLLGLADAVSPAAAAFVVLDVALVFGGLLGLLLAAGPRPSWTAIPALLALAATPQLAIYPAIVWKDVLFAGAALAGFACLAGAAAIRRRTARRWGLIVGAAALLSLAALARQNGAVMLPWGAICVGWAAGAASATPGRLRRGGVAALGFLAATGALSLAAAAALDTRLTGEGGLAQQWESLQVYDLAGALAREPRLELDVFEARAPSLSPLVREAARLYSPTRIDSLEPVLSRLDGDARAGAVVAAQWRQLILRHPWLYLRVRGSAFAWVLLSPRPAQCVMVYTGVDGPAEELGEAGLTFHRTPRDQALARYALALAGGPVLSHALYAALGLALLAWLAWRRAPADIPVAGLLAGALTFAASFAVISVACDYRYLYPLDLAVIAATLYAAASWRQAAGGSAARS